MSLLFSKEWYATVLSSVYPEDAVWYDGGESDFQLFQVLRFLDKKECNNIIKAFQDQTEPSQTTCGSQDFRTSSMFNVAYDQKQEHRDMMVNVERKICDLLNICFSHSEGIQFEHFKAGQYYKPHTDWFQPHSEEYETNALSWGQRTWTVQIALNEPRSGGEISFPELNGFKPFILPMGGLIAWNNISKEGEVQELAVYEHKPVLGGEKCILTKHFRMKNVIE